MKCQPRILAGTALGLLMASTPLSAAPLHGDSVTSPILHTGIILAQANCAEGESAEACAEGGEKPNRKKQQEKRAAPAAQDEPSPQAEPEQKPRREKRKEMQAEPAPREESAPADTGGEMAPAMKPEEKPRREKRKQKQQQAEPAQQNEQAAPAGEESETKPAVKRQEKQSERKQRRSTEEAKPAETEQAPAQSEEPAEQATQPKSKKKELKEFLDKKQDGGETTEPQQAEKPKPRKSGSDDQAKPAGEPAEEAAPKREATPAETEKGSAADEKPADQATQPKSKKEELREFLNKKKGGEEAAEPQQASPEEQKPTSGEKAGEQTPATGEAEGGKRDATQPELPTDTQEEQAMPKSDTEASPLPKDAAPLPDSAKKAGRRGEGRQVRQPAEQPAEQPAGEAEAAPRSDSAAQSAIERIGKIESVEAMQGKRIDAEQWRKDRRERREERRKRDNIDVVKEFGDRIVVKFGDNIYVDNRDANERLERHARDSYVEELPRGFTRTTIVKDNGARVVTIRNAYGDIVRRSRIMPDDREVVLYYVPEDDYDRIQRGYIDAGADLPPLRLSIPADEYILDAERARPEDYYTYLDAPPVEPVERIYSVNEVVHSARIRDKVRRVDLDTITFDTGSADIGENQISKLEALGEAMNKILEQNPAETFLIEGHTDAVGSDESNLVLSDERADSVAEALTKVFDIPAENLTTQGYGEEYLKVNTDGANRENRRVAVRRITPLVSPVASAE
ncbi:OmpA family protein [Manganibacter manganicus]|uniref:OmpA-like domain-containing protein n=1 Tax=Manganibacter manganicus TaxID=1873176 RepID=A0A1V8RUY9_9HYPH|nr:OmpA family protein [Pseudaminobacter manganicus]OQM76934.1 hypothetical protein BFN67_12160 [Pseudaminobacter manganicus]